MLRYKTIAPETLQLLKKLQSIPLLKNTRLVGGTSLALQLGHRQSVDLDLFGTVPSSAEEIREALVDYNITILKESESINIYKINETKVDIVNYRYTWIDEPIIEKGVILAGIKDIAAMKINAVIGRGTKKDFIDLYFLLKKFQLEQILDFYIQKYPEGSLFIAIKSLVYFDDAENDPMPLMFKKAEWDSVKKVIIKAVKNIEKHQ